MPAVVINGKTIDFGIDRNSITINGRIVEFDILHEYEGKLLVRIGNSVEEIIFFPNGKGVRVYIGNFAYGFEVLSDRDLLLRRLEPEGTRRHAHSEINAPMPGLVVRTLVVKGDHVKKGNSLVILEAMKMENEIRTPVDAEVGEVLVHEGDIVEKDQTIIRLA